MLIEASLIQPPAKHLQLLSMSQYILSGSVVCSPEPVETRGRLWSPLEDLLAGGGRVTWSIAGINEFEDCGCHGMSSPIQLPPEYTSSHYLIILLTDTDYYANK